jgi:hypothetical protein
MTALRPNSYLQEPFALDLPYPEGAAAAAVAATGTIQCDTNANHADGDTVTINDGSRIVIYEYDKSADGVTAGSVSWAAGASTAADVAATLKTAIEASQPAITVVDSGAGLLTLTHRIPGVIGNNALAKSSASALAVVGFTGGANANTVAATVTAKRFKATRGTRVDKVEVFCPAGFAAHADDHWTIALKQGSVTIASWSTDSDAQGALTANTHHTMVLSATDSDLVVDAAEELALVLTKAGSAANLPPLRVFVRGRYVTT